MHVNTDKRRLTIKISNGVILKHTDKLYNARL